MRVIAKKTLILFYTEHADSKSALEDWYRKISDSEWNSFADIKKDINSIDSVGNQRFVFNIKGNHYRIVALILFSVQQVYIRFVGTHAEYDKINDIKNI